MSKVEIIVGLDAIVDYSDNLDMDKEDLFELFSMVKKDKQILTILKTKDDKTAFFSTFDSDTPDGKQFMLIVHEDPKMILYYLQEKYVENLLNFEEDPEVVQQTSKALLILSSAFVRLSKLNIDDLPVEPYEDSN